MLALTLKPFIALFTRSIELAVEVPLAQRKRGWRSYFGEIGGEMKARRRQRRHEVVVVALPRAHRHVMQARLVKLGGENVFSVHHKLPINSI